MVLIPQPKLPIPYSQMRNDRGWYGINRSFTTFRLISGVLLSKNARICLQTYRCAVGKV